MIGSVLAHILWGLFRPRHAIEMLLARNPGIQDAALMVVAAYAVQRALDVMLRPGTSGMGLLEHVVSLAVAVASTFLIGFLVHTVGRAFGGRATREQSLVAAGWHTLVMTLLWPVVLIGVGEVDLVSQAELSIAGFLALALYFTQWVWLLARYTATIHGFRSDWNVVGVILCASVFFSALMLMLAGA